MKKMILTLIFAFLGAVGMNAQSNDCPSNSTYIQASCVSGCYSVSYGPYIGFVKPTAQQAIAIKNDLDERCSTFNGQANINQPGTITDSITP